MTSKVIVLIADPADSKYGEVAVLESTAEAERLVEVFLESGYDPERIRAFAGTELEARVSQRPKVDLLSQEPDPKGLAEDSSAIDEVEPAAATGEEEVERSGAESESGAQPVHDVGNPDDEGHEKTQSGGSSFFGRVSAQTLEMMPELLH